MQGNKKVVFALGLVLSLLFAANPVFAASSCKGLSKTKCGGSCTWVDSYTTKTGTKVNGYCRTKPGSSAKKASSEVKKPKPKEQPKEKTSK